MPATSASRLSAAGEDAHVAVWVSDEGPGLGPERLPQLFGKRAERGGGREGGPVRHGLGRAICKGLVEAQRGGVRAERGGAGRGTTVVLTLPVACEAGGEATGAPSGPRRSASKATLGPGSSWSRRTAGRCG